MTLSPCRPSTLGMERSMPLRQLVQAIPSAVVDGPVDRDITGLTHDSRRVTPGSVFVAVSGRHADGHDHIGSALERGAAAVICERKGLVPPRATCIRVPEAREAMACAARSYYRNPSAKLKVIGVTGTSGKTTVAFMIKTILEFAGLSTGLLGTVRNEIGDRVLPATRTTRESIEVQQMMSQMLKAGCGACVLEISSHSLEPKRVLGIEFDVAIFTNLNRDHQEDHGTMENYFAAKKRLCLAPGEGLKKAAAVIHIDDAFGARGAATAQVEVELHFGLGESARVRATRLELGPDGSRFVVEIPGRKFALRLPLVGRHNVYNALAAVGACLALQVDVVKIQAALNRMGPVPGRLERVESALPIGVFVDDAHTEDALRNVLITLRELTRGRLLLAFGCNGGRDAGRRPLLGRAAAQLADFTLITSDNPRREDPARIAAQIEEGYRSVRAEACAVELDRRRAIHQIIGKADPGDLVLVAGKGHDTYQEFEDTVVPFDDRIHAHEALERMGF